MNIIPARYTEVLYNYMHNDEAKAKILEAMSTYPLYQRKQQSYEHIPCYIPTREELNNAILNYYMYREIGFETFGRFLFELETTLKEIMPYYNQLFFSTDQDYDLLYNVDYTREIARQREDTDKNTSEATQTTESDSNASDNTTTTAHVDNYNKNINSKTPQGQLSITAKNINNVDYADEVSWNHDDNTDTATSNGENESHTTGTTNGSSETNGQRNENESTFERVKGNYGQISYQSLLKAYRELIINITQQIINDHRIAELFMLVY